MTAEDALRFLDHQAALCRDRDSHEALCLLLPALLKALVLRPMEGHEALAFRRKLKEQLNPNKKTARWNVPMLLKKL